MRIKSLLFVLLMAAGLLFSDALTLVRLDNCPDEALPSLIGLPLPYRTSIPWVNSMSGVLFVQGLLVDLLFWVLVVSSIRWGLARWTPETMRTSTMAKVFSWSMTGMAVLVIVFFFTAIEWHWQWAPDMPFQCPESTLRFLQALE
jgi:hypothetical protein